MNTPLPLLPWLSHSGHVVCLCLCVQASIAKTIDYNPYTGHDRSDFYSYNAL